MKTPALAALVALGTAVLALGAWSFRVRDLEVRAEPWRIHSGQVRAGAPVGEGFTAVRDGLERIDVAVTDFTDQPPAEIELVLRADGPQGLELRRVRAARLEPATQGGWLVFEFEPVADSAGRRFHAQLGPASGVEMCWYAPWIRFRGLADRGQTWGERVFEGPVVEGTFISDHATLRGLAFGGEMLGGSAELVLSDRDGREVRRVRVEDPGPIEWGWLVFGFEPIAESRWRTWSYRIELPPGGRLRGTFDDALRRNPGGPARVGFYGGGRVDGHLQGMTRAGELLADRDLVLRTWSERGLGVAWALLRERLGGRGLWAAACLASACGLLVAALGASRAAAPARSSS
jgi:hypothetical protein